MEAKELKAHIEQRGIKQSFIAKKLNISKSLVNQWLNQGVPIAERHQIELKSLLNPLN